MIAIMRWVLSRPGHQGEPRDDDGHDGDGLSRRSMDEGGGWERDQD